MKQIFLILFCFCSCTSSFIDEEVHSVDSRLSYYYESFLTEAKKRNYNFSEHQIVATISDLPTDLMGISYGRSDNIAHISIDTRAYEQLKHDTTHLKVLVYHELGHAFLKLDHIRNCSKIMHPRSQCVADRFEDNQQQMIDELFSK